MEYLRNNKNILNKGVYPIVNYGLEKELELELLSKEELINNALKFHSKGNIKKAKLFYEAFLDKNLIDPRMLLNYGVICNQEKKYNQAIQIYKKTIKLYPKSPYAYSNLGRVLKEKGKLDEAEEYLLKAINLKNNFEDAFLNLGIVLNQQCKYTEAAIYTKKAIEIKPDFVQAHVSLSNIFYNVGDLERSEKHARKAIKYDRSNANAHRNLSHVLIKKKEFQEGWKEYEWRWKIKDRKFKIGEKIQTNQPEWRLGTKGKVFLWCEQGIGDQILFSSLMPELLKLVDQLIIKIDERLIPLYKRTYGTKITYIEENQIINDRNFDYQIPMGSLPRILRPNLESFKKAAIFKLIGNEEKAKRYKKLLIESKKTKIVGISWKSSSKINSSKSIDLGQLIKKIYRPEIKFVNLQYGEVKAEIDNIKEKYNIIINDIEEIDKFNDIDSLAALISSCDEIISINNVTAHLAGALNINTKIILPTNASWDYGENDSTSYWYQSMRLYRQRVPGDWTDVLDQLNKEFNQ
tara:strand:+ start:4256 stop:5815 length:1560 start_codon:yes stop_codon:yes gene_type:complete